MADSRSPDLEGLPASLVDVAETLGLRVALALIQHFGGREMRFPKNPGPDHPVLIALGETDGRALCMFLADMTMYVPHARPAANRRSAADLARKGKTKGDIARLLGLSQRHVRRLTNGTTDPRQSSMFDDED